MLHSETDVKKWGAMLEEIMKEEETEGEKEEEGKSELRREKSDKRQGTEQSRPPTQTEAMSLRPPTEERRERLIKYDLLQTETSVEDEEDGGRPSSEREQAKKENKMRKEIKNQQEWTKR